MGACSLERHYAVIFPSELRSDQSEEICIQLEGAQGESRVEILLTLEDENTTLAEETFQDSTFTCIKIQVPDFKPEEQDVVATLVAMIENAGEAIKKSAKVLLKKTKSVLLIQTDKAVYQPGQKVKFRILPINEDYQPENRMLPLVEIQDPGKNRIRQWLNVNINKRIAEFSFPLSSEPPLGEYSIRAGKTVLGFIAEDCVISKYRPCLVRPRSVGIDREIIPVRVATMPHLKGKRAVLPKFEASLVLPKTVRIDSDIISFQICGKYTYGEPVQGQYSVSMCRSYHSWLQSNICHSFTGELDKSGCGSIDVETEPYKLNSTGLENTLKAKARITERGTGIQLSASSQTTVSPVVNNVTYVDQDYSYKAGIPYKVVVKVTDANDNPKQDVKLYFYSRNSTEELVDTSVTDNNGIAVFILNTTDWSGTKTFVTKTRPEYPQFVTGFLRPDYGQAYLSLYPFYSKSKSFLKLHSVDKVLPCGGEQEVQVEYIIKHTELKEEYEHLDLHYLVIYMGSIQDFGSLEINVKKQNKDLHGKATFKLPVSTGKSSTLRALVYILLPNGEILADSAKYNVQKCFKNKVSLRFSPEEVLPGSDVSVKVQADPGSFCGLRVVDKSVVPMKPEKELTADKVYNLFPYWESERYDYRIREEDNSCGFPDSQPPPFIPRPGPIFRPSLRERDRDVSDIFQVKEEQQKRVINISWVWSTDTYHGKSLRLKILTSAEIKKPVNCVDIPIVDAITDRLGPDVFDFEKINWEGKLKDNLSQEERKALHEHLEAREIVIKRSDKGGNLVLFNEKQYENEVFRLLGDAQTYQKLPGDPFPNLVATSSSVDEPTTTLTEGRGAKKEEEERVQSYFPETFLFGVLAVGTSGSAELHMKAPDTITDWNGGAICLGPTGFGRSSPTSLRVFQPFSVDLTLPSSVVRGEILVVKASIFSFMQDFIKIQSTLSISSDLEEMSCEECHHSSCIGPNESETFSWKLKPKVVGKINITVKTEALDTKELCKNKIPIVPKQGGTNTIVKSLLVQPGGVLRKKRFSSLMWPNEGKASSSVDEPTTTLTEGRGAKKEEEERVQNYVPETFPFGDLAVGTGGSAELQMKAPDTITDCNGGAVCLGPTRFARSSPTSFRVFQPFSVDVTLPSSVVQGEPFILTASLFNYMQDFMKIAITVQYDETERLRDKDYSSSEIQSTLSISSDLEEMSCEECHHSSCIGPNESETFSWKLKPKVVGKILRGEIGKINITVKTEALDTKELCKNKIPIVPKQGGTNTIVKSLLVQPGGVLRKKRFISLMWPNEGKGEEYLDRFTETVCVAHKGVARSAKDLGLEPIAVVTSLFAGLQGGAHQW
ncbi:alpha-2-macroglobulin-like [Lithobates pipiens]